MKNAKSLKFLLILALINFVFAKSEEETCDSLCKGEKPGQYQNLEILANPRTGIFLVVNNSVGQAIGVDVRHDMICLLNGKTAFLDVVNIKQNKKVVFNNTIPVLSKDPAKNFQYFLKNVNNFELFFALPLGKTYNLSDVPLPILETGNKIEVNFIGGPIPGVESNPYAGLQLAIKLSENIIQLIKGPLKGILLFLGDKKINGNIQDFGNVLQSMGKVATSGFQSS